MSANYYKSIIGDWEGFAEQAEWFERRCDSRLEVFTGLALLGVFEGCAKAQQCDSRIRLHDDHIYLPEPFFISPTLNGVSVAFLTCQFQKWDFCIHTGRDNGDGFSSAEPSLLIDVDGYGVHRKRRALDELKLSRASVSAMRLPEERFKDHWQMGWCIAWAGLFCCACSCNPSVSEEDCEYCNDIRNRAIFSKQNI
jgi:hypothetical protein